MNINSFLLTDTDGNKSVTLTSFLFGFVLVNLKLVFSGVQIGAVNFSVFGGGDYAAAVAALGAIYVMRRATNQPAILESRKAKAAAQPTKPRPSPEEEND